MKRVFSFSLRRRAGLLLSFSALAFLAACGGGEDDTGSVDDFFTISASPGGTGTFGAFYMAAITQQWRDAAASFRTNSSRFRYQSGDVTLPGGGGPIFSNPLFSSRVDYAHAVGLSGTGQVIAIVDSGFRQSHQAFVGKSNTSTGSPGITDHGTMVASIAAGNSSQMVGVAPGANLIFSDWGNDNTNDLTAAANAARSRRAVAQNNSWGFDGAFATQSDYDSVFVSDAQGVAWLAALRNYALGTTGWQGGVVIFAVDNEDNGLAGLMDGLPSLAAQADLQKAWIAVGNALPTFNDAGVTAGTLISSPCYQSAAWCIVADGYWNAATSASNSSYGSGTGSSFATPQVSGALALLAEAFPTLTPHQLRARLLASADNTFTGFVLAGNADLVDGPGEFLHSYSTDFGHGFLDIRAALLPIGQTVFATSDGGSVKTRDFAFSTGGAMGNAVTQSLDGIDLTATDALGGGFDVAAKDFATEADPVSLATTLAARSFSKDYKAARVKPMNPLANTFAAHAGQTFEINALDGATKAAVLVSGTDNYGIAVSRTLTEGDLKLEVGVKVARDNGDLMGFSDSNGNGGADMAALTLGLSSDVGNGGFFALSGEFGIADLDAPVAMQNVSNVSFSSVGLDIGSRGVFSEGDRLSVGVSMPMAVTSGRANMDVPVSVGGGLFEVRSVGIELAPEERQIDISVSYQVPMSDHSELLLEVLHAENYGNRAGISDSAAVIGMKWTF